MGFINSNNITVFPCGRRARNVNTSSRLTTEYNLVSIINRLVDKDSFIVTDVDFKAGINPSAENDENKTKLFSFNIGGYLFTTTPSAIFSSFEETDLAGLTNIYAYIAVESSAQVGEDTDSSLKELAPLATNNINAEINFTTYTFLDRVNSDGELHTNPEFVGIQFVGSLPAVTERPSGFQSLKLFEKQSDKWYFVEDSKIKFETNIDGTHRSVRIDDGVLG